GPAFNGSPNNLVWDRSTSTLLVSDPGTSATNSGILRIDPVTGNRTQVTGNGIGSGAAINAPAKVAVSSTGTIYYYENSASGISKAVVAVNPADGSRTVLSAVTPATGSGTAFINNGGLTVVPIPLPTTVSSINRVNPTPSN